ncbi:MAG TPA: GNAT family N-acetyltransferase [Gaiellales bacterium]|jgi:GNAT superfamily N-acetyltransferase
MERVERVGISAYRSIHPDGAAELDGATVLRMPAAHASPILNRIVGLGVDGPASEQQLDDAIAAMSGLWYYVSVSPAARPAAIGDWLAARGFAPSWGWMQFRRSVDVVPGALTSLTIVSVDGQRAGAFARLVRETYGLPEALEPIIAALPGRPGWHCWLALAGSEPAGAGALYVSSDGGSPAGYLAMAATALQHRGKGAQSALLATRIERARELGCDTVYTETGEQRPDRPSASYRNLVRSGFEELYVVPNWLGPPPGRGA